MTALHITDIEAAINYWRERHPSPDGVLLQPEVRALAEVYALMIFWHESEVQVEGFPSHAMAAWLRWRRLRWPEAAQPVAQPREHGRGEVIALVEQLVVGAVKALRLYHGRWRAVGKGLAAGRRHQPVVPRPHQQAGHAPLPRAGQH